MKRSKTEFTLLPAFHGDCILIKTFDNNNDEFVILIDGGTAQTFKYSLKAELKGITRINLLILTHIDSDHIAGLITFLKSSLLNDVIIDEIWMNHPDLVQISTGDLISIRQGESLKNLISSKIPSVKLLGISTANHFVSKSGIEFTILSPTTDIVEELYDRWQASKLPDDKSKMSTNISSTKNTYLESLEELSTLPYYPDKTISEDIFNASSISFLLTTKDMSILLLADSRPEIIVDSLNKVGFTKNNPLIVDYVKVSHHGSLNNTSQELLSLIRSSNYLISTNGGTADHKHPSRETIARIVHSATRTNEKLNIYFNHDLKHLKDRIGNFINESDLTKGNWGALYQNRF